jgi:hypothetical protein
LAKITIHRKENNVNTNGTMLEYFSMVIECMELSGTQVMSFLAPSTGSPHPFSNPHRPEVKLTEPMKIERVIQNGNCY